MVASRSSNFPYSPAPVAAIIFLVTFTIATAWHIFIAVPKRTWYLAPLLCGGILEVAGYASRTAATFNTDDKPPYIIQLVCILIAPTLFAASLYMLFSRLVLLLRAESLCLVRPAWVTKIFVGGDVVCFLVQLIGAATVSRSGNFELGKTVILVGLMAQIAVFGFFIVVAVVFHRRLARKASPPADSLEGRGWRRGWERVLLGIYSASALVVIRSLFRFIEFAGPRDGPLMTHEVYLYVFDSLLMLGVLAVLAVFHPAEYVPNKGLVERLSSSEMMDLRPEDN
ncbi:related to RTM1 protein [Cephalotrichum gorgonifer]|uniref:Related to RTM1 protein n=1 Tax=Cephalotrichum gorgonifer TaxID=2041049 RepID=A0AAE8MYU3_9PEZI|nr:related to RTM1 protein [Cephalotrichum gorgonifer]